jgi:hypothetical protein
MPSEAGAEKIVGSARRSNRILQSMREIHRKKPVKKVMRERVFVQYQQFGERHGDS